jgi:hypothetical protein
VQYFWGQFAAFEERQGMITRCKFNQKSILWVQRDGLKMSYVCERELHKKCLPGNLLKLYIIKIFGVEDMLSYI